MSACVGVFETMGVVAGRIPLWRWHERRLLRGAARLGLPGPLPTDVATRLRELAAGSGLEDPIVRLTWTRDPEGAARFEMQVRPRPNLRSVRLAVYPEPRVGRDELADVKHTARTFYDAALAHASLVGADDAVILDSAGQVLETATANLFWMLDGEWRTPAAHGAFLPGIARMLLLDALEARGAPAREGHFDRAELADADELVVVNAVHGPRAATLGADPVAPLDSEHPLRRAWCGVLERG